MSMDIISLEIQSVRILSRIDAAAIYPVNVEQEQKSSCQSQMKHCLELLIILITKMHNETFKDLIPLKRVLYSCKAELKE